VIGDTFGLVCCILVLSHILSEVAEIGLRALDDLQQNRAVIKEDKQRTVEFLKSLERPQVVLLLMVVSSVKLLVQATRTD
jgi:hypothetical protein